MSTNEEVRDIVAKGGTLAQVLELGTVFCEDVVFNAELCLLNSSLMHVLLLSKGPEQTGKPMR